jgi:hypothetical protein
MIPLRLSDITGKTKRRSKYGSVRTKVDGITFDSKKESARWCELKLLERAGDITQLVRQPEFQFLLHGKVMFRYIADFSYSTQIGKRVVEDVKGVRTKEYRLKKKLIEELHGIIITEV